MSSAGRPTPYAATAEVSLFEMLAFPTTVSLVALAALTCALVGSAGAGATLAGAQRLPRANLLEGIQIARRLASYPSRPWRAWPKPDRAAMPHNTLAWYAAATLPVLATLALITFIGVVLFRFWRSEGSTRGATGKPPASERRPGKRRTRLVTRRAETGRVTLGKTGLGSVFAPDAETHICVVAPPGQHKTTGIVIPALLEHPGAALVLSTKPDVYTATAPARRQLGAVHLYDPFGQTTCSWNPVDGCEDWQIALIRAEALAIAARRDQDTAAAAWWDSVAADLLAPLLHAAAHSDASMATLYSWVAQGDADTPRRVLATHAGVDEAARWRLARAIDELDALRSRDERTRASTWLSAAQLLKAYRHPALEEASRTNFHPTMLLDEPATLYIIASDEHQHLLRPIIVALVEAIYHAAFARGRHRPLNPRLLLALDETANIAPLKRLPEYLAQSRGAGITILTVWQDLSQLHARYDTQAGSILANSLAKVFLSGSSDPHTLDYLDQLLRTKHLADDETFDPRRLNGHALVLYRDHKPFLLRPRLSFQDRRLKRLAQGHTP